MCGGAGPRGLCIAAAGVRVLCPARLGPGWHIVLATLYRLYIGSVSALHRLCISSISALYRPATRGDCAGTGMAVLLNDGLGTELPNGPSPDGMCAHLSVGVSKNKNERCVTSIGLHIYGLYSYGLYSYGLCSYGLCSYGPRDLLVVGVLRVSHVAMVSDVCWAYCRRHQSEADVEAVKNRAGTSLHVHYACCRRWPVHAFNAVGYGRCMRSVWS